MTASVGYESLDSVFNRRDAALIEAQHAKHEAEPIGAERVNEEPNPNEQDEELARRMEEDFLRETFEATDEFEQLQDSFYEISMALKRRQRLRRAKLTSASRGSSRPRPRRAFPNV